MLEGAPGFEPGIRDLQSRALPLGYAPDYYGRGGRNRTRTGGFGDLCSAIKLRPCTLVAAEGLEPPTLRV